MSSSREPPWLPQKPSITIEEWETFSEQYTAELGFSDEPHLEEYYQEAEILTRESPFHGEHNWPLVMPKDSVTRIVEAKDRYEMFKTVVRETVENELGGTKPNTHDLKLVANHITSRALPDEDFQFSQVRDDDYEPSVGSGYSVTAELTIVVKSVNSRNYQDWYVYDISDANELFGSTLYSMTQAAHSIYNTNLSPDQVIQDVAFICQSGGSGTRSVPDATPPQHSVTIASTGSNDCGWCFKIDSPEQTFGDKWGKVDSMRSVLMDRESTDIGTANIFWVDTGVNL